jgi:hypothetical protein
MGFQCKQGAEGTLLWLCLLWAVFAVVLACGSSAHALEVTLAYDPPTSDTVEGYRLLVREAGASYDYGDPIWEGTDSTFSISGLTDGSMYYFVVRAYNSYGQSGASNEPLFLTARGVLW